MSIINFGLYALVAVVCIFIANMAITRITGFDLMATIFSLPFRLIARIAFALLLGLAIVHLGYTTSGGSLSGIGLLVVFAIGALFGGLVIPWLFHLMRGILRGWRFILWLVVVIFIVACGYVGFVM